MRSVLILMLSLVAGTAYAADELAACKARHDDLAVKTAEYKGEATLKRLIQADLDRAMRELREGDSEECTEALDHATDLLAGKI